MDHDHIHRQTFAILGYMPAYSAYAENLLARIQTAYRITLPEAVHTWFTYADVGELLERYSPDGHGAISLEAYLHPRSGKPYHVLHNLLTMGLFAFAVECQGSGYWAVPVNTESDPSVVFIYDYDAPQPQTIELRASTFSTFISEWFFEGATFVKPDDWQPPLSFGLCVGWSEAGRCTGSDIAALERRGVQLRQQHSLYRADRHNSVLIIENDISRNSARWYLISRVDMDAIFDGIERRIQDIANCAMHKDELVSYFLREPLE